MQGMYQHPLGHGEPVPPCPHLGGCWRPWDRRGGPSRAQPPLSLSQPPRALSQPDVSTLEAQGPECSGAPSGRETPACEAQQTRARLTSFRSLAHLPAGRGGGWSGAAGQAPSHLGGAPTRRPPGGLGLTVPGYQVKPRVCGQLPEPPEAWPILVLEAAGCGGAQER